MPGRRAGRRSADPADPGDGSVASLRRLLGELDDTSIDVEHLSIHSPDLDDVFFAVTGHATTDPATGQEEKCSSHDLRRLYP